MCKSLTAKLPAFPIKANFFPAKAPAKQTVLVCLPGGGAGKAYFNLPAPYSFAATMQAKGYDLLTLDNIGTGENELPPSHEFLTPHQAAEYLQAGLTEFLREPALTDRHLIGIGHSMGGMMMTLWQAHNRTFAGLGLLGFSAGGLAWGLDDHEKTFMDRPAALLAGLETLTLRKFKTAFPTGMGGPSGKSITFGGENPHASGYLRDVQVPLFAAGGMMSMIRGSFQAEVAAIEVPLFFACGDHDIGLPPEQAAKDFRQAANTTCLTLKDTGHNSFAFASLAVLCAALDNWLSPENV